MSGGARAFAGRDPAGTFLTPALARELDALSSRLHRFHRFAHHPLCDDYAGEVVRLGKRARVCRGCLLAGLGAVAGLLTSCVAAVPIELGLVLHAVTLGWVIATLRPARLPKALTRFLPALAIALVLGAAARRANTAGVAILAAVVATTALVGAVYRRRGGDRSPCARCPERSSRAPCRGLREIVRRERAFQRLAARALPRPARAGAAPGRDATPR